LIIIPPFTKNNWFCLAEIVDKEHGNGLLPTTRTSKNELPVLRGINRASSGLFSALAKLH
jgi:hypothetical protein